MTIGAREQNSVRDRATGKVLTVLDCQIGSHSGHFSIRRVRIDGQVRWGCETCIAEAAAATPHWLREYGSTARETSS